MCSKEKTKELGLSALFDCDCWSKKYADLAVELRSEAQDQAVDFLINAERKHLERKPE